MRQLKDLLRLVALDELLLRAEHRVAHRRTDRAIKWVLLTVHIFHLEVLMRLLEVRDRPRDFMLLYQLKHIRIGKSKCKEAETYGDLVLTETVIHEVHHIL